LDIFFLFVAQVHFDKYSSFADAAAAAATAAMRAVLLRGWKSADG